MSDTDQIKQQLAHFAEHIEAWRREAARLTLMAAQSRQKPATEVELTKLEETASAIYAEITAFQATVEQVAAKSPGAASELAPVGDAIHLVLLEITELGVRLYSSHSGMPHSVA